MLHLSLLSHSSLSSRSSSAVPLKVTAVLLVPPPQQPRCQVIDFSTSRVALFLLHSVISPLLRPPRREHDFSTSSPLLHIVLFSSACAGGTPHPSPIRSTPLPLLLFPLTPSPHSAPTPILPFLPLPSFLFCSTPSLLPSACNPSAHNTARLPIPHVCPSLSVPSSRPLRRHCSIAIYCAVCVRCLCCMRGGGRE